MKLEMQGGAMSNKIRIAVIAAGSLLVLGAVLKTGQERVAVAADAALDERITMVRTAPSGGVASPEEMERDYRSCLFTFLPRVGSDMAAEILRDACRDEYPAPER
jgi:hypothetical protein